MPNLQRLYHIAQGRQGLIDVLCLINSVDIMLSDQFFAASQIYECELRYQPHFIDVYRLDSHV